ncbi:hypothetical protein WJX82_002537 [Trebouxia sp. C0006]
MAVAAISVLIFPSASAAYLYPALGALWFEAFAGSVVASLVAQDRLVVLMRPAPETTMDNSAASSQTVL